MGGGVIRTAAKAAVLGGYRSSPIADKVAATVFTRLPHTAIPASPSPSDRSSVAAISSSPPPPQDLHVAAGTGQRRALWEADDWEFAGGKEELFDDVVQPAPRLVFGPVPSLDEAKEATSDLKDALEQIYFSDPTPVAENVENKMHSSVGSSAICSSAPRHVIQAFSLLKGSPEAQGVVASLASDKNVWDAVMNNQKVIEFYKSHQTYVVPEEVSVDTIVKMEKLDDNENTFERSTEKPSETTENIFVGLMNTIKSKVSALVSSISVLIQNFMSTPNDPADATVDGTRTASDRTVAVGSFFALAVAVIMIIMVKRA